jgi:hypothetical protein
MQFAGIVAGAAGVYGAIRADLAAIRERANMAAESADEAHKRIDSIMMQSQRRRASD